MDGRSVASFRRSRSSLLGLLDDPTIASKRWVHRQYDQQVLANTVVSSGAADAAVIRLRPQQGDGSLNTTTRGVPVSYTHLTLPTTPYV